MGDNCNKLTNNQLLTLYSIYRNTERDIANVRASYFNFYLSLSFILLGAILSVYTVVDDFKLKTMVSLFLSISICVFSIYFYSISKNLYRNQIEYIAMCAHIEDILDLSNADIYCGKTYWQNEGIIIDRHLESRIRFSSKTEFINKVVGNNDNILLKATKIKEIFKVTQIKNLLRIHLVIGIVSICLGLFFIYTFFLFVIS